MAAPSLTKAVPFAPFSISGAPEGPFCMTITAMECYRHTSLEELRLADYQAREREAAAAQPAKPQASQKPPPPRRRRSGLGPPPTTKPPLPPSPPASEEVTPKASMPVLRPKAPPLCLERNMDACGSNSTPASEPPSASTQLPPKALAPLITITPPSSARSSPSASPRTREEPHLSGPHLLHPGNHWRTPRSPSAVSTPASSQGEQPQSSVRSKPAPPTRNAQKNAPSEALAPSTPSLIPMSSDATSMPSTTQVGTLPAMPTTKPPIPCSPPISPRTPPSSTPPLAPPPQLNSLPTSPRTPPSVAPPRAPPPDIPTSSSGMARDLHKKVPTIPPPDAPSISPRSPPSTRPPPPGVPPPPMSPRTPVPACAPATSNTPPPDCPPAPSTRPPPPDVPYLSDKASDVSTILPGGPLAPDLPQMPSGMPPDAPSTPHLDVSVEVSQRPPPSDSPAPRKGVPSDLHDSPNRPPPFGIPSASNNAPLPDISTISAGNPPHSDIPATSPRPLPPSIPSVSSTPPSPEVLVGSCGRESPHDIAPARESMPPPKSHGMQSTGPLPPVSHQEPATPSARRGPSVVSAKQSRPPPPGVPAPPRSAQPPVPQSPASKPPAPDIPSISHNAAPISAMPAGKPPPSVPVTQPTSREVPAPSRTLPGTPTTPKSVAADVPGIPSPKVPPPCASPEKWLSQPKTVHNAVPSGTSSIRPTLFKPPPHAVLKRENATPQSVVDPAMSGEMRHPQQSASPDLIPPFKAPPTVKDGPSRCSRRAMPLDVNAIGDSPELTMSAPLPFPPMKAAPVAFPAKAFSNVSPPLFKQYVIAV